MPDSMALRALDLFAGAGGWDIAAESLGWDVEGVEIMPEARATRAAAGLKTSEIEDVRDVDPEPEAYDVVIGSPSCKRYSPAGNGAGRRAIDTVLRVVHSYRDAVPLSSAEAATLIGDEDAALVVEPLRIILGCVPTFVALEQASSVLPIWRAYAEVLRERDYSVAVGILSAEQYGVPQTRKRAILVARRDGIPAVLPAHHDQPGGPVSLGWALALPPDAFLVSNYGTGGDPKLRGRRWAHEPAMTVTSKADRIKVHVPAQGVIRNLTEAEAAALQGFPNGFPFQGSKSKRMEQIGNAVPIRLALAILRATVASGQGLAVSPGPGEPAKFDLDPAWRKAHVVKRHGYETPSLFEGAA